MNALGSSLRIVCQECNAPLEVTLDYPDTIKVAPCACVSKAEYIEDLEEEAREDGERIKRFEEKIEALEDQIFEKDSEMDRLTVQIDEQAAEIDRLNTELAKNISFL